METGAAAPLSRTGLRASSDNDEPCHRGLALEMQWRETLSKSRMGHSRHFETRVWAGLEPAETNSASSILWTRDVATGLAGCPVLLCG